MEKRRLLLIVSVAVMLQLVFSGICDVYEVCDRVSKEAVSEEETYVPGNGKLPPDAVIIHTGQRYGSIQRENHELILGGIMKWVLGVGFFVWRLLKYMQEKRLTEFMRQRERKNLQQEINIMLDKEKRWKEYRNRRE